MDLCFVGDCHRPWQGNRCELATVQRICSLAGHHWLVLFAFKALCHQQIPVQRSVPTHTGTFDGYHLSGSFSLGRWTSLIVICDVQILDTGGWVDCKCQAVWKAQVLVHYLVVIAQGNHPWGKESLSATSRTQVETKRSEGPTFFQKALLELELLKELELHSFSTQLCTTSCGANVAHPFFWEVIAWGHAARARSKGTQHPTFRPSGAPSNCRPQERRGAEAGDSTLEWQWYSHITGVKAW